MAPKVVFRVVLDPVNKPDEVGEIVVEVHEEWAPLGAKCAPSARAGATRRPRGACLPNAASARGRRFLDLVDASYFDEMRIYRVIPGFICQWGIPATPAMWKKWGENKIKDDPVKTSNTRGTMSFATSGPNARGSQVFINYDDSCSQLDSQGCAFARPPCARGEGARGEGDARQKSRSGRARGAPGLRPSPRCSAGWTWPRSSTNARRSRGSTRGWPRCAAAGSGQGRGGRKRNGAHTARLVAPAPQESGNAYFKQFPKLSYIKSAARVPS